MSTIILLSTLLLACSEPPGIRTGSVTGPDGPDEPDTGVGVDPTVDTGEDTGGAEAFDGPWVVLYGGDSMVEPKDWAFFPGTFNVVQRSLDPEDPEPAQEALDTAESLHLGLLASVSWSQLYDVETGAVDVSAIQAIHDRWGEHAGLMGYLINASDHLPKSAQAEIYSAVKAVDDQHPLWTEFSATDASTWIEGFDPAACDVLLSYNYPYEADDAEGDDPAERRIGYSTAAINGVSSTVRVVPLIQSFGGGGWRFPPEGGQATQLDLWKAQLDAPVEGVGFYRWRDSSSYVGIRGEGAPDYLWPEVQALGGLEL